MIRGELAIGRGTSRHTLVFGGSHADPNHDAVMRIGGEAPGGGPILPVGICACLLPVPATSDRQSAVRPERQRERRIGKNMLFPEAFQPAGRKMTPSNVSPVVTKRQSAISSLRAMATIIVLRVPTRLSAVRAGYHGASALCF